MHWNSIGTRVVVTALIFTSVFFVFAVFAYLQTQKQKILDQEISASRKLIDLSDSIRSNMLDKWQDGVFTPAMLRHFKETESDTDLVRKKILATVPVATSWQIIQQKAESGGFLFKAPRHNARNPANNPDELEGTVLDFFASNPDRNEYYIVDEKIDAIRFFRAVRLAKQCEICHGDPATAETLWGRNDGKDILGYPMDNKRAGDLHGAFEIITPLSTAYESLNQEALYVIAASVCALLLIGLILYNAIRRQIVSPLTDLALKLQNIAGGEGDLTSRLNIKGKNEFAWVAKSFNSFAKKIHATVSEIRATSEQLAQSSTVLSTITQQMEIGVKTQQAETDQVASAITEMNNTTKEVVQIAQKASDSASKANQEAVAGKRIVQQAVSSINQLADEVENAGSVIRELEADSESIGDVLSVIQNIAEQTNLLALNAAIEAARAGEQGRGFAVVADEVRTLASRTQNSTEQIRQTIERLQSRARNAVTVMKKGQQQAKASVTEAISAGQALESIQVQIEAIDSMNLNIATTSERQNQQSAEINNNISNIRAESAHSAERAGETSSASTILMSLAEQMKSVIGSFKT